MAYVDLQLVKFKEMIEQAIIENGTKGKESVIRSQALINLIHDSVKHDFIARGCDPEKIYPHFEQTKPELKLAGYLKQKDQDICIVPKNIAKEKTIIDWGPLAYENKEDAYGFEYTNNTLIINVRSQMSSLAKNSDTLFERTFAEAFNLHLRYCNAVLGEVYLIPTHEYNEDSAKRNIVEFSDRHTDLEKYISFFNAINNRAFNGPAYAYERCALMIVDFNREQPYLFRNSEELKNVGLISGEFDIEYETMNYYSFFDEILSVYSSRFQLDNLE